jgi:hypothetical protein
VSPYVRPEKNMKDPYFKLRPSIPTPDEELCKCEEVSELYLACKLGTNPVYCLRCNGEVLPDKLAFEEPLAEEIASWNSVYGSLYQLWLDSGEYEEWGRDRLLDPKGEVNARGMEIVKELSTRVRTYYFWFDGEQEVSHLDGLLPKAFFLSQLTDCVFL